MCMLVSCQATLKRTAHNVKRGVEKNSTINSNNLGYSTNRIGVIYYTRKIKYEKGVSKRDNWSRSYALFEVSYYCNLFRAQVTTCLASKTISTPLCAEVWFARTPKQLQNALGISKIRTRNLRNSESRKLGLGISETRNLRNSETRRLEISETRNHGNSEARNLGILETRTVA